MNKSLYNKPYLCGNKLDRAPVTELRLLDAAENLGEKYRGEDISLRRGTGFGEEGCLLGNDTMLIGFMPPKRRKTFTSPHDVFHNT